MHSPAAIDPGIRLGLEADAALRQDPRLWRDPRRLGQLHAHWQEALGGADARAALAQAGFLHGLRDARARRDTALLDTDARLHEGPRIPFDLRPGEAGAAWIGAWFQRGEAEGHLAGLGRSERPVCAVSAGYTSGWLSELLDEDVLVRELECAACGAETCRFEVLRRDAWASEADALDFDALHESLAGEDEPDAEPAEARAGVDPDLPVVHVWGPVMVVPYSGPGASISALELIVCDDQARDVSVVVIDLGGTLVDAGVGALALAEVLEAVERCGADAVLAGVSPASEPVVAQLQDRHLLIHRALPDAIAAAFQIATAQRRVY